MGGAAERHRFKGTSQVRQEPRKTGKHLLHPNKNLRQRHRQHRPFPVTAPQQRPLRHRACGTCANLAGLLPCVPPPRLFLPAFAMATPSGLIRALHRGTLGQVTGLGYLPRRFPVCPVWDGPRAPVSAGSAAIAPRAAGRLCACAALGARGGAGPAPAAPQGAALPVLPSRCSARPARFPAHPSRFPAGSRWLRSAAGAWAPRGARAAGEREA